MTALVAIHLWQSTLVLVAAWVLTFLYRRNAAEVRFLIWFGASLKFLLPLAALQWLGDWLGQTLPQPLAVDPLLIETANAIFTPSWPNPMGFSDEVCSWLAALAATLWACGSLLLAWRWAREWRTVRSILSASQLLPIDLPLPVYVARRDVPLGVFGIVRPAVIVPEPVLRALGPQQLAAVLAHEHCHVRRCDNLLAAIHRCVETLFWFHPLVWWIGTQLLREREAACDECVIEEGHERQVYAESILDVCRLSMAARFGAIAASGGDLVQRVSTIMSRPQAQPINGGRFSLLLAAVTCLCFAPLFTGIAGGADRAAAANEPIRFESLDLQSAEMSWPSSAHFDAAAGRLTLQNVSVRHLIRSAYPRALVGGDPYVIDRARYDIQASWHTPTAISERAAYRELLRRILPRNVQLLVDGRCEVAC
jgi:Zn-dependent protease with chaperone function